MSKYILRVAYSNSKVTLGQAYQVIDKHPEGYMIKQNNGDPFKACLKDAYWIEVPESIGASKAELLFQVFDRYQASFAKNEFYSFPIFAKLAFGKIGFAESGLPQNTERLINDALQYWGECKIAHDGKSKPVKSPIEPYRLRVSLPVNHFLVGKCYKTNELRNFKNDFANEIWVTVPEHISVSKAELLYDIYKEHHSFLLKSRFDNFATFAKIAFGYTSDIPGTADTKFAVKQVIKAWINSTEITFSRPAGYDKNYGVQAKPSSYDARVKELMSACNAVYAEGGIISGEDITKFFNRESDRQTDNKAAEFMSGYLGVPFQATEPVKLSSFEFKTKSSVEIMTEVLNRYEHVLKPISKGGFLDKFALQQGLIQPLKISPEEFKSIFPSLNKPVTKGSKTMQQIIIKQVTTINDRDSDQYTDTQLLEMIAEQQSLLENLETFKVKSRAINALVKKHTDNIKGLTEILDARYPEVDNGAQDKPEDASWAKTESFSSPPSVIDHRV